ncbi:MAG: hypothetical protein ACYTDU_16900 [Planctomycetota bacterium]|jgi:hypothetical protein
MNTATQINPAAVTVQQSETRQRGHYSAKVLATVPGAVGAVGYWLAAALTAALGKAYSVNSWPDRVEVTLLRTAKRKAEAPTVADLAFDHLVGLDVVEARRLMREGPTGPEQIAREHGVAWSEPATLAAAGVEVFRQTVQRIVDEHAGTMTERQWALDRAEKVLDQYAAVTDAFLGDAVRRGRHRVNFADRMAALVAEAEAEARDVLAEQLGGADATTFESGEELHPETLDLLREDGTRTELHAQLASRVDPRGFRRSTPLPLSCDTRRVALLAAALHDWSPE